MRSSERVTFMNSDGDKIYHNSRFGNKIHDYYSELCAALTREFCQGRFSHCSIEDGSIMMIIHIPGMSSFAAPPLLGNTLYECTLTEIANRCIHSKPFLHEGSSYKPTFDVNRRELFNDSSKIMINNFCIQVEEDFGEKGYGGIDIAVQKDMIKENFLKFLYDQRLFKVKNEDMADTFQKCMAEILVNDTLSS